MSDKVSEPADGDASYTVWKYPLEMSRHVQSVMMPWGSFPVHVAAQDGVVTVWAWVDPHAPVVQRRMVIVGTGCIAPSPRESIYLGAAIHYGYVWHVFEQVADVLEVRP